MHDSNLEERLRSGLRDEGDRLPLTITTAELERRLVARRRDRTGQRVTLVAAAVAVVAVGAMVALTNGWLQLPAVGANPSATPATSEQPVPSASDASAAPTSAAASPSSEALPCDTLDPSTLVVPPTLLMGATPGDSIAYGGVIGSWTLGGPEVLEPDKWLRPEPDAAPTVPAGPSGGSLEVLTSGPDACLTRIVADAYPAAAFDGDLGDTPPTHLALIEQAAARVARFDAPGPGLWVVRVDAIFDTASGEARTINFFRVEVADPAAQPTAPPTALPDLGPSNGVVLLDLDDTQVGDGAGADSVKEFLVGDLARRGHYSVSVVCLGEASDVRWSIGRDGMIGTLTAREHQCDGTVGTIEVSKGIPTSVLAFFVYADPGVTWHVRVSSLGDEPQFVPPGLTARAEDQGAGSGSLTYLQCANINGVGDSCAGPYDRADGMAVVTLPRGPGLHITLGDEWLIANLTVTAVPTALVQGNAFPQGERDVVRGLEPASVGFVVPVDLPPGPWILRVFVGAQDRTHRMDGWYDVPIFIPG